MATNKRAARTTRKPEIEPIFLSMWERIELHANVLSERGSYEEAIMTLELRDRLKPQPDEIESMDIQVVAEGAWLWNKIKEGVGSPSDGDVLTWSSTIGAWTAA